MSIDGTRKRAKVDDEKQITRISGKDEAENRGFLLAHHGAVRLTNEDGGFPGPRPRPPEAHDRDTMAAEARRQARNEKRLRRSQMAGAPT